MKNKIKLIITCVLLVSAFYVFADGDCYTYDRWGEIEYSPDSYIVQKVYIPGDFETQKPINNPQGIFCVNNKVFLCDTGNNRIIEMEYSSDKKLSIIRIIDSIKAPENITTTFASPSDIYINAEGTMFVADTNNNRVVKFDKDLNFMLEFLLPDDPTYDKSLSFMPIKVIADVSGRAYILAKNVNKGFLKYENDGTFTGFYGASEVHPNWYDLLWKKLSTRRQREQSESFVPTEYSNVYEDSEGFLYAVLNTFDVWKLKSDEAKPIRRLNALGGDILIKNAINLPIGDLQWEVKKAGGYNGPSRFEDITVLDNNVYLALDGTRGRIFGYNNQGYLLFAFGGKGNHEGFYKNPIGIEHINRDLFVVDSNECSITILTPTHYGNMVYDALEAYSIGEYEKSAQIWQNVLQLNGNYDLAYTGLGKAELRQKKYKEAMEYFSVKRDRREYSKAFVLYRKEWFEANIGWIFGVLVVVVLIFFIIKKIKKIRQEVASL